MTPLHLIPGMLCDHRLWEPVLPLLATPVTPRHHHIAHVDHLQTEAAAFIRTLNGAPFILAGLSMGGYLALEIMRQLLERGEDGQVRALILLATSAQSDAPEQTRTRQGLIKLAEMGRFKGVTPKLMPTLIHHSRLEDASVTSTIYAMADATGLDGFIRQEKAVIARRDQHDILPQIRCPALVIVGDGDQRTPPACSRKMAERLPASQLHILEHCGHLPPLEQPAETARIMENFLRRL